MTRVAGRSIVTGDGVYPVDLGMEKRFHFHNDEWAARVAVVNATGHQNPDTLANTAGSPIVLLEGRQSLHCAPSPGRQETG